jgi:hypothetical protein
MDITNIPNKICTIYGFMENLGHNLFNEYTGLYILYKTNLISYIDEIIFGNFDPFFIYEYFKKSNKKINKINDINTYDNFIGRGIIFKYNHHFISKNCISFLKNNLKIYNVSLENNELEIENIKKNHYPIINIILRCGTRILKNQVEIYSDFINKILLIYPNAYFYFDGFVRNYFNTNINVSSNKCNTNKLLNEYNNLVYNITNKIKTKNYKSLINMYSYQIISYLNIANYTLYSCGSGCIISGWISNIPGIHYGKSDIKIYENMDKFLCENNMNIEYNDNIKCYYNDYNEYEYDLKFDLYNKCIDFLKK